MYQPRLLTNLLTIFQPIVTDHITEHFFQYKPIMGVQCIRRSVTNICCYPADLPQLTPGMASLL